MSYRKSIEVDCNKVWRIIGFTLWGLASLGLGFGSWIVFDHTVNGYYPYPECYNFWIEKGIQVVHWNCDFTHETGPVFYLCIIGVIGDIIAFSLFVNHHFRLLELRCKDD